MDVLNEVVDEIEAEQERGIVPAFKVFRSILNQPSLVSISSASRNVGQSANSFSNFSVAFPRTIFDVESIQLVNANIPQCTQNVPDTACVFWYYRLSLYSGNIPSVNNLHFVRLLPSYYQKEFISFPDTFGFNQTFNSYQDISTQLQNSCMNDLGTLNWSVGNGLTIANFYKSQYYFRDITIAYDSNTNRFQMNGLNRAEPPAWTTWNNTTAYLLNQKVIYNGLSYTCIQANTGQRPGIITAYWIRDNQPVMASWSSTTAYGVNRYVSYSNVLYVSLAPSTNQQPDTSPTYWGAISYPNPTYSWNTYLITGFNDPNVAKLQGSLYRPYDDYTLFEVNDVVDYNGTFYKTSSQTIGSGIPSSSWIAQSTPITKMSNVGVNVYVTCDTTFFATTAINTPIYIVGSTQSVFNVFPSNYFTASSIQYLFKGIVGSTIYLTGNINLTSSSPSLTGSGGRICLAVAPDIGLASLSGQFDMNLPFNGIPVGIPPQPYISNPKRLLNSILGFTWNGVFDLAPFILLSQTNGIFASPSVYTSLYNRLRPVPGYQPTPDLLGLSLGSLALNPSRVTLYTAEGYANLNYSSIISLYTTIASASTMDTQQNTNLLATCAMNCANLGVSFFEPKIANEIMVRGVELDTISISMFDEFGDPYIVTNNGVVTITLRMTYKDRLHIK